MMCVEAILSSFLAGKQHHWYQWNYTKSVVSALPEKCCQGRTLLFFLEQFQFEGLPPCLLWLSDVSLGDTIGILMLHLVKEFNSSLLRHRKMLVTLFLWRYCISIHLGCVNLMEYTIYTVSITHSPNWTHNLCPNTSQSFIYSLRKCHSKFQSPVQQQLSELLISLDLSP